jgi:hypothetical protein
MKTIVILKDRAEYIVKELGDKCKYIEEAGFLDIEIDNNDISTLTSLFHAGIEYGFDRANQNIEQLLNKKLGVFNY